MSETPAVYHVQPHLQGNRPQAEADAALGFALSVARGHGPMADAGRAFLLAWYAGGTAPSGEQVTHKAQAMREQIDALTGAYRAALSAFVDQLAEHPSPRPGTPLGDYYDDLVQLQSAAGN